MTLQQKLLAKKSKKGFTLVELVVVIAILGILAAIAIPAVIGIINSAQSSQRKSDAASIDTACNDFYAGVVSGVINDGNKPTGKTFSGNFPKATANATDRKTGAQALKAADALTYSGLDSLIGKGTDFFYSDGHIYSTDDEAHKSAYKEGTNGFDKDFGVTFKDMGFD